MTCFGLKVIAGINMCNKDYIFNFSLALSSFTLALMVLEVKAFQKLVFLLFENDTQKLTFDHNKLFYRLTTDPLCDKRT